MALTNVNKKYPSEKFSEGGLLKFYFTVDMDASYDAGGEALTATTLGFNDPAEDLIVTAYQNSGYTFEYDNANEKLKAFRGKADAADSAAVEVTAAVDLSAVTKVLVVVLGRDPV